MQMEKWLENRNLKPEILKNLGVRVLEKNGAKVMEIPFFKNGEIVNSKYRGIDEKFFYQTPDGQKCAYNFDCLFDEKLKDHPVILTEGECDTWAALQVGFNRVISVPDGAPAQKIEDFESCKYDWLEDVIKITGDSIFILAVDADGPGDNLLHDLSLRIGRSKCKWVKYPKGCKDLNDALIKYGEAAVMETINRAEWLSIGGIGKMSDLPPSPSREPHKTGMFFLDNHYKIRMGDFCVITGIPSHGKSAFVTDLCCNVIMEHGWNVCFASFEQDPVIDHKRNLRKWKIGHSRRWSIEEMKNADKWIDEKFCFIKPSFEDDVTLDWTLDRCHVAATRYNSKIIVIDPWNEMDHFRPRGMSLTEYVSFAIKQFKKFALEKNIHLIVVAHPVKQHKKDDGSFSMPTLYDISDSSHWFNKPDVGIVIHRKDDHECIIRIAKSRYHDIIGKPGDISVKFDILNNRYSQFLK